MGAAGRLFAIAPIVAGLVWLAMAAVDVIRADTLAREAATEMSTWADAGTEPAIETWTSVHDKLVAALALRPREPSFHELLGLLGTMRRESSQRMDEGVAHLVKALELRPVAPHTWANHAAAQYARGDPPMTLELAFSVAAQLGPSEPGVQRLVADHGLAVWNEIRPAAQVDVDRLIAAGIRRNPLEMLQISNRRGRLETACRHVLGHATPDPRAGRYCEQWEITP